MNSTYVPKRVKCSLLPPLLSIRSQVVNRIPAQRAGVLIAALEPLVQTRAMEQILARGTSLIRHALITRDDGVANRALALSLQRPYDVALEDLEAVDDVAIREGDDALGGHDPGLPLPFRDGYAMQSGD